MGSASISELYNRLTGTSPAHHPDCCSSLSGPLIRRLAFLLPPDPALTLSIGSGTGLLEALLLHHRPLLNLKAIEVPTATNKFMPYDRFEIVNGYRDLCILAADAKAWMFIYPRDALLLQKYVQAFGNQKCELIIWIGPKADQLEVDFLGKMWIEEVFESCGLEDYEAMALWRRCPFDTADFKAASR